jgi:murein tripeptide amidase MpaA
VEISSQFDTGSITVLEGSRPDAIKLELPPDNAAPIRQWFHFRASGVRGAPIDMTITNAGATNQLKDVSGMPDTWEDYNVVASYDRRNWFRLPTAYDGKSLNVRFTPKHDSVWFAQFPPHTLERHHEIVARAQMSSRATHSVLGRTLDGQDLDLLTIGEPGKGKKSLWFITRQHPSETAGAWMTEGVIDRLLDEEDAIARALLKRAVCYVVPNMNPDGSRRGNTRTNAAGANLNREWKNPTMARSPEVFLVREHMDRVGVHACVDAHAWAGTHVFALGPYNVPSITPRQSELWRRYDHALARANPDFEAGWPYPGGGPKPGEADTAMCWNWLSERGSFGVLYELLFKDNRNNPDPVRGWSIERSRKMGFATLDALYDVIDEL